METTFANNFAQIYSQFTLLKITKYLPDLVTLPVCLFQLDVPAPERSEKNIVSWISKVFRGATQYFF